MSCADRDAAGGAMGRRDGAFFPPLRKKPAHSGKTHVLVGNFLSLTVDFDYNAAMRRIKGVVYLILAGGLLLVPHVAYAQQTAVKKTAPKPTVSISGKDLYREYCAVCHGVDGRGDGPAASALKMRPTDLTRMAKANGGRFPEEPFLAAMRGERTVLAHGSGDMPIWGSVFQKMSSSPELAQTRLHGLLNYVEEMQK
jgi:mono/diheme cytochrome c family protein